MSKAVQGRDAEEKKIRETGRDKNSRASDKMGTMAMNPLLLSMALPMMISMLVQALYNIVDSVFVSMINEVADDRCGCGNRGGDQRGPFQKPGRKGSGKCG